ncbi:hypothetical protein TWF594_002861 [Orbilia oligospora]|nr:hypothetical protein TWF594_002861 [Orbilia oligospora]
MSFAASSASSSLLLPLPFLSLLLDPHGIAVTRRGNLVPVRVDHEGEEEEEEEEEEEQNNDNNEDEDEDEDEDGDGDGDGDGGQDDGIYGG